jgi:serine/threonine protein kinase
VQAERYRILDRLGSGGMGEVYRALAQGVDGFQKPVVIKRIHKHLADRPELAAQFINEAKIAMGLLHGNIVQVLDLGKTEGEYYIAFEYVDGRDLRDVMKRCRELGEWIPREIAIHIICGVLNGLDYAHRRTDLGGKPLGIIHRDVTPANILCSFEGEVKLADFGIARTLSARSETLPGGVKGSLRYMSPEQALGAEVDQRTDIYSVGVNLYFALCGAHPYGDDSVFAVAKRVRAGSFLPPSSHGVELPEELESIVLTAMAKEREDRYPTAQAMLSALESYQRTVPHATASDLRAFMQRIFERDAESWSQPAFVIPEEARDSLVGTEIEICTDEAATAAGGPSANERLRRALRVEGVIPRVPTQSDPVGGAEIATSPTVIEDISASGQTGWGRAALEKRWRASAADADATDATAPRRRWPLGALLAVVAVAVIGAAIALGLRERPARMPAPAASASSGGRGGAVRAPAAPARGLLTLRSRPPGAAIAIDGASAGVTPASRGLPLGRTVRVELRLAGHTPWSTAVALDSSAPKHTIDVTLHRERAPTPSGAETRAAGRGWLRVSTRPSWAEVMLGGRKLDVTPCRVQLPAGSHTITLVNHALGKSVRRRVVIRGDREAELTITDF